MKLKTIRLKNFMPYKGEQELVFPTGSKNVCVVYGDNMRGKTSFLNAIRFAFYGRATARHLRTIDRIDLFNVEAVANGDWELSVAIQFENDGIDYDIRRELRPLPHVARPQSSGDLKEFFAIRKGGIPLSGREITLEMNQALPEGISRFFLFDGELLQEYEELVFNPANASKIKSSIEAVLGVPALTSGLSEIQHLLSQAQVAQAQELKHSKKLQAQAERQISLQAEIGRLKHELGEKKDRRDKLELKADELQAQLEKFSDAIEMEKELLRIEGEIEAEETAIREKRSHRAGLLQDGWIVLLQPRLLLLRQQLGEDRGRLLGKLSDSANARREADDLRDTISSGVCSICHRELDRQYKDAISERLGEIEGNLKFVEDVGAEIGAVQSKIDAVSRIRCAPLANRVVTVEKEIRSCSVRVRDLLRRHDKLKETLNEYSGRDAARIRTERENIRVLSVGVVREIEELEARIRQEQRKLDQTSRLLSRNPATRAQKSSKLVSLYTSIEDVFEISVDRLRDKQRDRVEDFASDAFRHLTSEPDYDRLEINENYGLTILDKQGRSVQERSAGAEQVVALSLIDGLNRAGRRGGPIVMDTPFGRLDWTHRANILRYLPEMAEQVILLVHEGELDPQRELPILKSHVGGMYRIRRVGARHSEIEEERLQ